MCCMMGHGMGRGEEMERSAVEAGKRDSLLDVLRGRYAKGEITRDQLEEMRAVLDLSVGKPVGDGGGNTNPWEAEHHG